MRKQYLIVAGFLCLLFLSACKEKRPREIPTDAPGTGTINISVEESFGPVIDEQISVYQASWPNAKIVATRKSEADCMKDFFRDSATRLVVVARGLTYDEEKFMKDSLGYSPSWNALAVDAVAVVVNINSTDTLFTKERLHKQMTGELKNGQVLVFDGLNATGTLRYMQDSVLKGKKLDTAAVRGVRNSDAVLDYVATHENAVGFVGINRIGNPEDPAQRNWLSKVKIARVKCEACVNSPYVFPSQATMLTREYPLVRGLYYLLKEGYTGLGADFVAFMKYERGQLIFRRAYLAPLMNFNVRNVKLNERLPED